MFNKDAKTAFNEQVHKTTGAELLGQYSIFTPGGEADKPSGTETLDEFHNLAKW